LAILSNQSNFDIVFDVSNGNDLIEQLQHKSVDIVILDLEMPVLNGFEALQIISKKYPFIKVVILSSYYENEMIYQALTFGAKGFLPKHAEIEKVIESINAVMNNDYFFDEKITPQLISRLKPSSFSLLQSNQHLLSERELEVLPLICEGLKNKEIASKLFISERTVENHRKSIFVKTNSKNAFGLIVYAIKNGLIDIN
jgi:DNA-binding NarL/FixJ family response regulator